MNKQIITERKKQTAQLSRFARFAYLVIPKRKRARADRMPPPSKKGSIKFRHGEVRGQLAAVSTGNTVHLVNVEMDLDGYFGKDELRGMARDGQMGYVTLTFASGHTVGVDRKSLTKFLQHMSSGT